MHIPSFFLSLFARAWLFFFCPYNAAVIERVDLLTTFNVTGEGKQATKFSELGNSGTSNKCLEKEKSFSPLTSATWDFFPLLFRYWFSPQETMASCMQQRSCEWETGLTDIPLWILISFLGCFLCQCFYSFHSTLDCLCLFFTWIIIMLTALSIFLQLV